MVYLILTWMVDLHRAFHGGKHTTWRWMEDEFPFQMSNCLGSNTYFSLDKLVAQNFYRGSIIFKHIYPPRRQDDLLGWFCSSKFESSNQQKDSSVKSCHMSIRECYMLSKIKNKKNSNFIDILAAWWLNQPIWKILYSQIGSFPLVGMNIKNIWVATTQSLISLVSLYRDYI